MTPATELVVERQKTMDAVRVGATVDWARSLLEKRRSELALHHQRFPYTIDKSMAETAVAIELAQAHDQSQAALIDELQGLIVTHEIASERMAARITELEGEKRAMQARLDRWEPSTMTSTASSSSQARSLLSEEGG